MNVIPESTKEEEESSSTSGHTLTREKSVIHTLKVARFSLKQHTFQTFNFVESKVVEDILKTCKEKLFNDDELKQYDFRLWSSYLGNPYQKVKNVDVKLSYLITSKESIKEFIIEYKNSEENSYHLDFVHKTIENKKKSRRSIFSGYSNPLYQDYYQNRGNNVKSDKGVVGLNNLGNTCFMNSALQCLSKTKIFVNYFTNDKYKPDINADNPLGMGGKIATSFGDLMDEMWSGNHSVVAPREFKFNIGKFAPQFSGYNQQDSAELIAYLLDGLHEDLNRVKKKPYTEVVEGHGKDNKVVAASSWKKHQLRNDSIIVDRFQGQYRSELQCPDCDHVSVIFDPFMYLSVPLPGINFRSLTVMMIPENNPSLRQYNLTIPKFSSISSLKEELSKKSGIPKNKFVLCDVFAHKVYKFYEGEKPNRDISNRDKTYAYEISKEVENQEKFEGIIPFCQVKLVIIKKAQYAYHSTFIKELCDYPFVFECYNNETTFKEVHDKCLAYTKRFLKKKELKEKFGIDVDDPSTCFKIKETEAPQEQTEDAALNIDTQEINTEDLNIQTPAADAGDDADASMENKEKTYLFRMQFQKVPSSYRDDYSDVEYSDEKISVEDTKSRYSSIYDYKHLRFLMVIEEKILDFVDVEEFNKIEDMDEEKKSKEGEEKKDELTIYKCIKKYCEKEKLGKNDSWYCPECKNHVEASKKIDLWKLPEILVIQIKRFTATGFYREKLESFVHYPLQLNLEGYSLDETNVHNKYNLYAVSNHFGGLGGGHYNAFAKVNEQWYEFDDSSTRRINKEKVIWKSGYVLFYQSEKTVEVKETVDEDLKMKENDEIKTEESKTEEDVKMKEKDEEKIDTDVIMKEKQSTE